jgi:hypothetical protein
MKYALLACIAGLIIALAGCHKKSVEPPGNESWRLDLRAPAVMYRNAPLDSGGYVLNDTILVRLYRSQTELASGVTLHCTSSISPDSVTSQLQSYGDTTLSHFAGSTPPLIYWGSGSPDTTVFERVDCWGTINDITVRDSAFFRVLDPVIFKR